MKEIVRDVNNLLCLESEAGSKTNTMTCEIFLLTINRDTLGKREVSKWMLSLMTDRKRSTSSWEINCAFLLNILDLFVSAPETRLSTLTPQAHSLHSSSLSSK